MAKIKNSMKIYQIYSFKIQEQITLFHLDLEESKNLNILIQKIVLQKISRISKKFRFKFDATIFSSKGTLLNYPEILKIDLKVYIIDEDHTISE